MGVHQYGIRGNALSWIRAFLGNRSKHFTEQNILSELQHGFREKRSCETQLIMLVDELSKSMQSGKQTDLILLDFSKAFNKVAHEKLLLKLHFYGIRGNILNWIKDFLDNRTQSVILNGTNSDNIAVSSGVPQGSVLGPILFLAYIHHIYINCWFPLYRWSVMEKQVTSTPPIPGNGGVLVTCIYITDHL